MIFTTLEVGAASGMPFGFFAGGAARPPATRLLPASALVRAEVRYEAKKEGVTKEAVKKSRPTARSERSTAAHCGTGAPLEQVGGEH